MLISNQNRRQKKEEEGVLSKKRIKAKRKPQLQILNEWPRLKVDLICCANQSQSTTFCLKTDFTQRIRFPFPSIDSSFEFHFYP